ncbi:putative protein N(5)-glutamine methyltransferase [Streptomyces polyrhachis]|uniref:peptide chain release factor N(5)-glutamine methyltransferase n=1 Tax=Streptomyces polyrhachis TaxID=1282885 RepID=A0ABW2GLF1_9ACTN
MIAESGLVARLRAAGCVFAEDEARLLVEAAGERGGLEAMVRRRVAGLPLEQVVGWTEFRGRRVVLAEGVFVPRRRSEFLAGRAVAAAEAVAARASGVVVLDLCCGVGAVGAAVAAEVAGVELHAADLDPAALACARRNVAGAVYEGDLYAPLPASLRGRVDVLVANAPYVPTGELELLPAEARLYEPRAALDGGADGLDVQRRIAAGAAQWLAPGGTLLIETSGRQEDRTVEAFRRAGLRTRVARCEDLAATVVEGTGEAGA